MVPLALAGLALGGSGMAAYGYMSRPGAPWGPPPADGSVAYEPGSLERGHAVVAVSTPTRIPDVESTRRSFGGRAVHLRGDRAASPATAP